MQGSPAARELGHLRAMYGESAALVRGNGTEVTKHAPAGLGIAADQAIAGGVNDEQVSAGLGGERTVDFFGAGENTDIDPVDAVVVAQLPASARDAPIARDLAIVHARGGDLVQHAVDALPHAGGEQCVGFAG